MSFADHIVIKIRYLPPHGSIKISWLSKFVLSSHVQHIESQIVGFIGVQPKLRVNENVVNIGTCTIKHNGQVIH